MTTRFQIIVFQWQELEFPVFPFIMLLYACVGSLSIKDELELTISDSCSAILPLHIGADLE